jgi:hypothetical protein
LGRPAFFLYRYPIRTPRSRPFAAGATGVRNLVAAKPGTLKKELGAIRVGGGRYEAIYMVGVLKC